VLGDERDELSDREVAIGPSTDLGHQLVERQSSIVVVLNRFTEDNGVNRRQAEIGEVMLPGAPVATIADLDHVWVRAYINETDIGKVRFGQAAIITTDSYPGKSYAGRISAIASQAEFTPKSVETHTERVTLVYRIKIDVFNPTHELVPGMPADATIDLTVAANGNR